MDELSTQQQQQQQQTEGNQQIFENQQTLENQPKLEEQQLNWIIHPTQSLPPSLRTIRRSFELLSVSYFLNIFAPALSIQNFTISKLEADLDGSQPDSYLPSLIPKLLVSLTGDRTTNYSNWESRLRREFLRREPQANPLGEEPAKTKPKITKRAVGYVYIAETIPLSTLPTVEDLNSQYAQLTQSNNHRTSHQVAVDAQTSINPSHPQPAPSEIDQTPSTLPDIHPPSDTPELTNKQSPSIEPTNLNQVDGKSYELLPSDSNPSDKPLPEYLICHAEPLEPKPLTASSSKNSSPAPQHPAGSSTITWSSLSPTLKLKSLFKLCEWHFSTSTDLDRFRRLVDTKAYNPNIVGLDEHSDWRQERCGLDSKGNQYWLTGQGINSRLWVQRREPQPPPKAITLRIPARTKKKENNGPSKQFKRKHVSQESTTTPSTPVTTRNRRYSSGAPPDSKRAKLTGTRSSQRLRATQAESSIRSTSPRPPTMIVIKRTAVSPNSQAPHTAKQGVNGSRRPTSRRRTNDELWQHVPPGWLDEVVEPTSKQPSTVLSSDLSEMSDDDEFVADTRQSKPTKSKPMTIKPKPTPVATDNASTDESLTELSDSSDPSTAGTCESLSEDSAVAADRLDEPKKTEDKPERHDEVLRLPKTEDSSLGQKINVGTAEVAAVSVKDDPDQKPSDVLPSNIRLSKLDDSLINNAQPDPPGPAQSTISSIRETSTQLATPESNVQTNQLIPKVDSGNLPPCDVEHIKPCSDNPDPLYPELKGHPLDPDWIEWEVVCADLNDWKSFCLQFRNAENHSEKQLVEFINDEILPQVIATHNEEESRKQKEEAMALRKRSSRLATREAVQATSMEVGTSTRATRMHSDRLEAKRMKEIELEQSKKQNEEDQRLIRLRERESKIALQEAQNAIEREAEDKRAERARLRAESKLLGTAIKVAKVGVENSVPSIDSTEQWKLNCEICGVIGVNMNDGSEVICCDKCEIWQHVVCHDRADEIMKRPRQNWATADFICADCSGIPIPRVVKKLRTPINGRPKAPRPRASKPKDELNHSSPTTPGPSTARPKITILMSNPSRFGGTTLNEINPANNFAPSPTQLQNANPSEENTSSPRLNGNLANQAPSKVTMPRPSALSSSLPSARPTVITTRAHVPDLTKYYDDLDKLCAILRMDTNLHRTLPIEVMHRLRQYLLDQRQREQQQLARSQQTSNGITSISSNVHSSLNNQLGQSITISQSTPYDLQQNHRSPHLHSASLPHDPQMIDPQLQQLANRPEPLDINTNTNANAAIVKAVATTTTTTSSATVANHMTGPSESEYGHF